mgnify:FL=1
MLYPDGCYSEKDRALSYLDRNNANGIQGLISFWIKSNHTPPTAQVRRGHPFLKWTNFSVASSSGQSLDQFFFLGDFGGFSYGGDYSAVLCKFEIGHSSDDSLLEHAFEREQRLTPHRWSLLTMYYDLRSLAADDCGELLLDADLGALGQGAGNTYPAGSGNNPVSANDFTMDHITPDGSFGPHTMVLGAGRPLLENSMLYYTGSGSDATFDELAIYDIGGAGPDGIPAATLDILESPGKLARKRFHEGRYYRESDYPAAGGLTAPPGPGRRAAEYFSPLIRLGACRIRTLAWTEVVPRGLRAPLPVPGQAGVDGDPDDGDNPGDGRILLELSDASGTDYLRDVPGQPIAHAFTRPAASRAERTVSAPFRLHAVFQPNLADKDNTPILDPLALDDITLVYEPVEGRRLLAWGEGPG